MTRVKMVTIQNIKQSNEHGKMKKLAVSLKRTNSAVQSIPG